MSVRLVLSRVKMPKWKMAYVICHMAPVNHILREVVGMFGGIRDLNPPKNGGMNVKNGFFCVCGLHTWHGTQLKWCVLMCFLCM